MIHVRKINVNMEQEPIKRLRAQIKLTDGAKATKDKELYRINMQIKEGELKIENRKQQDIVEKARQ